MSPRRIGPPRITSTLLTGSSMARARRLAKAEEVERAEQAAKMAELAQREAEVARDAAERRAEGERRANRTLTPRGAKISRALKGRKKSAKTRAKISRALRGRPFSAEHRAKLSCAMKGRKLSATTRARMSATRRGRTLSAQTRAKIAQALRGRTPSAETRAKISRKTSLALRGEANPNYWHGGYAAPEHPVKSVDEVIEHLAAKQARLSALLDQYLETDPFSPRVVTLFSLSSQTAGKLGQLLRYQESQSHLSDEDITQAIHQALDEIAQETGWDV